MRAGGTIIVGIMALIGLYIWGHVEGAKTVQTQAIQRGYALYCPTDDSVKHKGKFAWSGECGE